MQKHMLRWAMVGLACLQASSGSAESFKILGSRAVGMAGAFVAVAEDSMSNYWNPAGLAQQKRFDVEIPVGARVEFTNGVLQDVNKISDLANKYSAIQSAQQNGGRIDADQLSSIFTTVNTLQGLKATGKGVLVDANAGLNVRVRHIGISVNNFTSVGATPFVDTQNVGLGASGSAAGITFSGANTASPTDATLLAARDNAQSAIDQVGYENLRNLAGASAFAAGGITNSQQLANALVNQAQTNGLTSAQILAASTNLKDTAGAVKDVVATVPSGSTYNNNTSNVTLRGISVVELGAGYAHRFFVDDLYVGGNLKALIARVGFFREEFLKKSFGSGDSTADFDKNTKQSAQPGVDLGLMYDKREKYFTKFGLVARNINSPKFDQPAVATGESQYRLEPQVRAGIAIYPLKRTFWVIASDLDLTSNITPVPGFSSRMWALGTEVNVVNSNMFNLALRAGITTNVAESNSKIAYAGGIGLKMLHFFLDLSGSVSSEFQEIKSGTTESQKAPQNAQIALSLGLNF